MIIKPYFSENFLNFFRKIFNTMSGKKVILEYSEAKNADVTSCDNNISLIKKWEMYTGRKRKTCSFGGCSNNATCARFLKIKGKSLHYFIGAICSGCNRQSNNYYENMKKNTAYIRVPASKISSESYDSSESSDNSGSFDNSESSYSSSESDSTDSSESSNKIILEYSKAKNVQNSSCDRASGSWISKWEECTGRQRNKCSFSGCLNDATCGGHLHIKGKNPNYHYIGAICSECNGQRDDAYIEMKKNTAYMKIRINRCVYDR